MKAEGDEKEVQREGGEREQGRNWRGWEADTQRKKDKGSDNLIFSPV